MPSKPTYSEILAEIEGYNIDTSIVSQSWIENKRDNTVIKFIERKTGLSLSSETEVIDFIDGSGLNYIFLPRRLVNSIVKVEYLDSVGFSRELSLTAFTLISDEGLLKGIRTEYLLGDNTPLFPKGTKNIKVTSKVGWAADSLPDDIVEAIKCFTCEKILGFLSGRGGGGSISVQGYSRNHGNRGKYTDIRRDLAQTGMNCLSEYLTGVV